MLKLQTYTSGTMTLNISNGKFFSSNENSLWKDRNLYEFYKIAYTPREQHGPIMQRARELDMLCFSTAFDETAVDF